MILKLSYEHIEERKWRAFTWVSRTSLMYNEFDDLGTFKSQLLCGYGEEYIILESKDFLKNG